MKKAFVCFYEAYPPQSGAAVVSYCSAKYSSGERLLLQVCSREAKEYPREHLCVQSINANSATRIGKVTGLTKRLSRVITELKAFGPDVIVLEGASWVMYHYLLLRRIRRSFPKTRVAYHSHNVELLLRQEKHGPLVCRLTGWAEGKVLNGVDHSYAVSEVDADLFEKLYHVRPSLWPNGIDSQRFDDVTEKQVAAVKKKYGIADKSLIFMGLYAYKPNTEAVDFLRRQVMPRVLAIDPEVQLVITGGEVPFNAPWLNNPGMVPFEEIAPLVKSCSIGLAPIFSGSGTRLKILEYMASGLPVISTRKGAEGLGVTDKEHLLYAESPEDFSSAIETLLLSPPTQMIEKSMQLLEQHFYWPVALNEFESWSNQG